MSYKLISVNDRMIVDVLDKEEKDGWSPVHWLGSCMDEGNQFCFRVLFHKEPTVKNGKK